MAETSSAVAARMRGSSMINLPAGLLKMARHDIEEQQLRLCGVLRLQTGCKEDWAATPRQGAGDETTLSHIRRGRGIADCCVRPRCGIRSKIGRDTENTPWRQPGEDVAAIIAEVRGAAETETVAELVDRGRTVGRADRQPAEGRLQRFK